MLIATFFVSAGVWAVLAARIVRDPTNHVAFEPFVALLPFLLLLAIVWLPRYQGRRALRAAMTAFAVLSVISVVAMDRANLLVQYDRWAQRGMPEKPCNALVQHLWACSP